MSAARRLGMLGLEVERRAVIRTWAQEHGYEPLDLDAVDPNVDILVTVLKKGQRAIPQLSRNEAGLVLLAEEALVRPVVYLGAHTCVVAPAMGGPPLGQVLDTVSAPPAPAPHAGRAQHAPAVSVDERTSADVWRALVRSSAVEADAIAEAWVPGLELASLGVAAFAGRGAAPESQGLEDALSAEPSCREGSLGAVLGNSLGMALFARGQRRWIVYWPHQDGILELWSRGRLPPRTDLQSRLVRLGARSIDVEAEVGDVMVALHGLGRGEDRSGFLEALRDAMPVGGWAARDVIERALASRKGEISGGVLELR